MKNEYYCKSYWVRDKNRNKVGYLVAYTSYDSNYESVKVGFSFCDTRFDKFDKYEAMELADQRAEYLAHAVNVDKVMEKIPYKYREDFLWFADSCSRYFKDKTFPLWFNTLEIYDFIYES